MPELERVPPATTAEWPWFTASLALSLILLLPMLAYPLGFDQGIMQYLALAMRRGEWPYTEVWDTSFPGGPLLHLLALVTGGPSALAIRALDLGWELATCAALFVTGNRMAGREAGLYSSMSYAIVYRTGGYYSTAQRDGFLVLPMVLGMLAFWNFLEKGGRSRLLLSAALLGVVSLIRPTYAMVGVAVATYLLLREWKVASAIRRNLLDAVLFGAAAAAPILLFFAIYAISGRFLAIRQLLTADGRIYPLLEQSRPGDVLLAALRFVPWLMLPGAALTLVPSRTPRHRAAAIFLAAIAFLCLVIRLWESKDYRYQFWPLIACMALLAGVGWAGFIDRMTQHWERPRGRVLLGAGLMVALLLVQYRITLGRPSGYELLAALGRPAPSAVEDAGTFLGRSATQSSVAVYLREHLAARDRVQLWGPMTGVLVAARARSATRFIDPFTFFCDAGGQLKLFDHCPQSAGFPLQRKFRDEIIATLQAAPPKFIVAHYADGSLAVHEGPCLAPDLPELRAILDTEYERAVTFGNWTVFRRKQEGGGGSGERIRATSGGSMKWRRPRAEGTSAGI